MSTIWWDNLPEPAETFTCDDSQSELDRTLADLRAELTRAHELHGGQHLPSGCGPETSQLITLDRNMRAVDAREELQDLCAYRTRRGRVAWSDVLLEEVFEFLAEDPDTDPDAWRAEAVQVICTVVRALTDHRTSEGDRA